MHRCHPIFKKFIIISAPIIIIFLANLIYNENREKQHIIQTQINALQSDDQNTEQLINRYMSEIIENIKVVRDANDFTNYFEHKTPTTYAGVTQLFVRILHNKQHYAQIRYIDPQGREIIRVNNTHNKIKVVPKNELQNKADRYYFKDAMKIGYDKIYISPLDLNVENNKIDVPHQPMLRFAAQLRDKAHHSQGVLVINYYANEFIWLTRKKLKNEIKLPYKFYILNKDSQFIYHPDEKLRFSFLFPAF